MNRFLIFIVFAALTINADGQKIRTGKMKKLRIDQEAWFPEFGKNHREILFSGPRFEGLYLYNSFTGKILEISKEDGAGNDPQVLENGNIVYLKRIGQNGKQQKEYFEFNRDTRQSFPLEKADLKHREAKTEGKKIRVFENETSEKVIQPLDDKYLIWVSLSPDKERILFTAAGDGSYICDLNGKILQSLGYLNDPSWIDNNWVLGMNDQYDGHKIASSDLVIIHIPTEKRFNLTEHSEKIALYPDVSPDLRKIIFHTPSGEVYTMKINLRSGK